MRLIDMTGQRFGRLVVLHRGPQKKTGTCWIVQCDCGARSEVMRSNLLQGVTTSCGCFGAEQRTASVTTHGQSKTPTYKSWLSARHRCISPGTLHYEYYGGRGIKMCDRWLDSFEAFLEDMGERPVGTTIERRDPNGHYAPDNCRWATRVDQALNQRGRKQYFINGTWLNLSQVKAQLQLTRTGVEKLVKTLPQRVIGDP